MFAVKKKIERFDFGFHFYTVCSILCFIFFNIN
jgi:hypothetical protein